MRHAMTLLIAAAIVSGAHAADTAVLPAPAAVQWHVAPPMFGRGVRIATLSGDPSRPGLFTIRVLMPPHATIAPHTHDSDEALTVISGQVRHSLGPTMEAAHERTLRPGGYVALPKGDAHAIATDDGPAVLQVSGMGPFGMHYVNPADDPSHR